MGEWSSVYERRSHRKQGRRYIDSGCYAPQKNGMENKLGEKEEEFKCRRCVYTPIYFDVFHFRL